MTARPRLAVSFGPHEHFPDGPCPCGAGLAAAVGLRVAASHQVTGMPLETAKVTQHDLREVARLQGPPRLPLGVDGNGLAAAPSTAMPRRWAVMFCWW